MLSSSVFFLHKGCVMRKNELGRRNAIEVVNYILQRGRQLGKSFTPMQMIKLVYLANGWFIAVHNESRTNNIVPLVREKVEAWKYGPVIPIVYHAVKQFRASPIKGPILGGDEEGKNLSDTEKKVIDIIIDRYGDMEGSHLSSLTHQPGTPWEKTEDKLYGVIDDAVIFEHFTDIMSQWKRKTK